MSYISSLNAGNSSTAPAKRQVGTFMFVLAAHIGLFILLVLSRQAELQPRQRGSLSMFALAAAAPLARPVPVIVPIMPEDAEPATRNPAEVFAEQQGAKGDPDGVACSPIDVVTTELANDPMVPMAITRVPRNDRSISEAIVMWNAEWSSAAINEEAPMAEVRQMIHAILSDLPSDCLAVAVIGPRLVPITDENGRTTFLAFGSGEWSWQQLVEPPDTIPTDEKQWTWDQLLDGEISSIF